ncbi:hypothetical protein DN579_31165, partial [Burkholderia multivorans]
MAERREPEFRIRDTFERDVRRILVDPLHGLAAPPLVKYALTFLFVQAEFGLCCPVSMTDSLTRTLRR